MKDSLKFNFTTHLNSFKLQAQSEFQNGINALWGKSGSGKTTFFNSLSGFLNTIEGEIIFNVSTNSDSLEIVKTTRQIP